MLSKEFANDLLINFEEALIQFQWIINRSPRILSCHDEFIPCVLLALKAIAFSKDIEEKFHPLIGNYLGSLVKDPQHLLEILLFPKNPTDLQGMDYKLHFESMIDFYLENEAKL